MHIRRRMLVPGTVAVALLAVAVGAGSASSNGEAISTDRGDLTQGLVSLRAELRRDLSDALVGFGSLAMEGW